MAGLGNEQTQLVSVGVGSRAAGGAQQGLDGVAIGKWIQARIGDGAADVDIAGVGGFFREDDFQRLAGTAACCRDDDAGDGDDDQSADDD